MAAAPTLSRLEEQQSFLTTYWTCLMVEHDWEAFAAIVHPDCVVHYPGNHFLSGDHVGRKDIVALYTNLYKLGIEQGTFIGEFHDATTSNDHACAIIKYRIIVGPGMEIPGEAIGVFHLENGQMVEYWLLERDQKMINDIVNMSGKAALAGGRKRDIALGVLTHPLAAVRTGRRVARQKRGKNKKML